MQFDRFRKVKRRALTSISLLMAVGVVAFAVSACGSSSSTTPTTSSTASTASTSSTAGTASTSSTSSASKTPIDLGSVVSETGTFGAGNVGAEYGVKAWAQYTNAHGGLDGHPVNVTVSDDQGEPSPGISATRAFASNPKIVALIGNSSSAEGSMVPLAAPLKLPIIGGIQFTSSFYSTPYAFPVGATFPSILWGEVYTAVKLSHDPKMALFYCAELAGCATATASVETAAKSLGGDLVNHQGVPATAPNYDAQCKSAQSSGATAIVLALGSTTISALAQSCASIGYHPTYIAQTTAFTPNMGSEPALQGARGVLATFPWVATATPAEKVAAAAFKAANVPAADYGDALTIGWASGVVLAKAVDTIKGPITRASVAQALWSLPKGTTTGGITPPLNYGPADKPTAQQKCFFILGIGGGKFTDPYNSKTFCQP